MREHWTDRADCKTWPGDMTDALFREAGRTPKALRMACQNTCTVRRECLREGLRRNDYGVWGGLNSTELARVVAEQIPSGVMDNGAGVFVAWAQYVGADGKAQPVLSGPQPAADAAAAERGKLVRAARLLHDWTSALDAVLDGSLVYQAVAQ